MKFLKGSFTHFGYRTVLLYNKVSRIRKTVHRLIAETFYPLADFSLNCNHKDGDKSNNHIDNLEFISARQNTQHFYKTKKSGGASVINQLQVRVIRKLKGSMTQRELAEIFGVCQMTISSVLLRKTWKYI
jgi:hypothetical protein